MLWLLGFGVVAFNILNYVGLGYTRPQSASLISALSPLFAVFVAWGLTRVRPARITFVCVLVALFGVVLVISHGHPASYVEGGVEWGDLLCLGGVLAFAVVHDRRVTGDRDVAAPADGALLGDRGRADGGAGGDRRRRRLRPVPGGGRAVGRAPRDRLHRPAGRDHRHAGVEPLGPADRRPEHGTADEPRADHGVRDPDHPRLPPGAARVRRRRAHARRGDREQPARPSSRSPHRVGAIALEGADG